MATTANQLRSAIAAFLHRDQSAFVVNGYDVLLRAMNNARLYTERRVDFELARCEIDIPGVSILNGADLSVAVLHGTATSVRVKKLQKAFLKYVNQNDTFPIDIISRDSFVEKVKRRYELTQPTDNPQTVTVISAPFSLVQLGTKVFVSPADSKNLGGDTITLYADAFKFLPDYGATAISGSATSTLTLALIASAANFITSGVTIGSIVRNTTSGASAVVVAVVSQTQLSLNADIFVSGNAYSIFVGSETDFLLDNCFDWLQYRAIYELNFFLKEDERVQISDALMKDAWLACLSWNENMIKQAVDNVNLS